MGRVGETVDRGRETVGVEIVSASTEYEQFFVVTMSRYTMVEIDPQKNKTTQTSFRVLDGLAGLRGGGVTDLAVHLDMPKSTVYKHLATLRDIGYVRKDGSEYYLGAKFVELGETTKRDYLLYRIGRVDAEKLALVTGDIAGLFIEERGTGTVLVQTRGDYASKNDIVFENTRYLHASAPGKALLAQLPEARVDEILDRHGLPRVTENTITDRGELREQLETIRDRGIAFESGEQQAGYHSIAATIGGWDDPVLGSLYVAGPPDRMSSPRMRQDLAMTLESVSQNVEGNLGDD